MATTSNGSDLKPIKLYGHAGGPNPWKVAMILKQLGLPYETEYIDFSLIKKEPFISVNPNGRVPAIEDPNTGITLWESGAIIQYLADRYDTKNTISFPNGTAAAYQTNQWLFFQVSGQGPYMGQAAWFTRFHHEKLPSAIERYVKETERIVGVIDSWLKKTGQKWLVADEQNPEGKLTYADISFVVWGVNAPFFFGERDLFADGAYKDYKEWIDRLQATPSVAETLSEKAKAAH